ncbi:hypothetical protein O5D80_007357 [Batrachochytrium dendrobatidis]|nr:hypothetical protein O5D80_007357 [Batrachochytrium dendrobatidis]
MLLTSSLLSASVIYIISASPLGSSDTPQDADSSGLSRLYSAKPSKWSIPKSFFDDAHTDDEDQIYNIDNEDGDVFDGVMRDDPDQLNIYHTPDHIVDTKRAVDLTLTHTFSIYMKYASSIYCENVSLTRKWQCGPFCQGERSDSKVLSVLYDQASRKHGAAVGAIVLHKQSKSIVIIFRGTASSHEWRTNLNFAKAKLSPLLFTGSVGTIPPNVMLHSGFQKAYLKIQEQLRFSLNVIVSKFPQYKIIVTGHSLGGALASIAIMDIALHHKKHMAAQMHLYTYGMPRTGNGAWANWVNKVGFGSVYRIVRTNDPVPHLPVNLIGYKHFGTGVGIDQNSVTVKCRPTGDAGETSDCDHLSKRSASIMAHTQGYYYPSGCQLRNTEL